MIAPPIVMKFGGTSVEDTAAFEHVTRIVTEQKNAPLVVVVSAMSRVTDALVESINQAVNGSATLAFLGLYETFERHLKIADNLLSNHARRTYQTTVRAAELELEKRLSSISASSSQIRPLLQDQVVSYGEQLSSALLASVLCEAGLEAQHVDARLCVVTDERHGCAVPLLTETNNRTRNELRPLLAASKIPVLGGFIGVTKNGATTTLGRNGSDYTASLVGAALNAREIQIWTDVSGILTADPRLVSRTRTIQRMSYTEAVELSYFGAKVIYPKAIQPAAAQCIPLRICNSRAPHEPGTIVCTEPQVSTRIVKSISHKTGLKLIRLTSQRMPDGSESLRAAFDILEQHCADVCILTVAGTSISFSLEETSGLPLLIEEMGRLGTVEIEESCALICIVGEGLSEAAGIMGLVLNTLSDLNISPILQSGSSSSMAFVFKGTHFAEAVRRLHELFFEDEEEAVEEDEPSGLELIAADN